MFSLFCFLFFLEVVAQRPKCSGSLLRRQSSWLNNWIYNNTITKNREKMNMKSDEISNHYRNLMEHILNTYICKDAFFLFLACFLISRKISRAFMKENRRVCLLICLVCGFCQHVGQTPPPAGPFCSSGFSSGSP